MEYCEIRNDELTKERVQYLTARGWQLVTAISNCSGHALSMFFKRERNNG